MSSSDALNMISEANHSFLCSLYKTILKDKPDENIFFSPLSISLALSMTLAAAKEKSHEEMKKVLCYDSVDEKNLHLSFRTLLNELTGSSTGNKDKPVSIASGLFINKSFQLLQPFTDTAHEMYNAISKNLDFSGNPADARLQINQWVKDATREKIPELIENPNTINPNTVLIIVNAIYFKSLWMHKFDRKLTSSSHFHLNKKDKVKVRMMKLRKDLRFTGNEAADCDVLELPYKDGKTSMIIFLPKKVDGLAKVESLLSAEFIKECLSTLEPPSIAEVWLPCFKMEDKYSLVPVLKEMGMQDVFHSGKANLQGISKVPGLYVSEVIHQSVIDVNEEGTEAAAATAVVIKLRCLRIPIPFKADHPFMFCIVDNSFGSILFVGSLKNPPPS